MFLFHIVLPPLALLIANHLPAPVAGDTAATPTAALDPFAAPAGLASQPVWSALSAPRPTALDGERRSGTEFSYTFIEVGYYSTDIDAIDESSDAIYGRASLGLFNFMYVFLDYATESVDAAAAGDVDNDQIGLGLGAHFGMLPNLDLVGEAAYLYNDISSDQLSNLDDTNEGWTAFAGARWMALPWSGGGLEINGGFRWIDQQQLLSDDEVGAWELGARFHFLDALSVGLRYAFLEDDGNYAINARFSF